MAQQVRDIRQLHEEVLYPTVRVRAKRAGGSGTVLYSQKDTKGDVRSYILTNHHVIGDLIKVDKVWDSRLGKEIKKELRSTAEVHFFQYNNLSRCVGNFAVEADVVAHEAQEDMALLELRDRERVIDHVARLIPRDKIPEIHIFDEVYAVGATLGHPPIATSGNIMHLDDEIDDKKYVMATSLISFGNCLPGGSLISMSDGSVKKIKDICPGDSVLSWGHTAGLCRKNAVQELVHSGVKQIFKVRTKNRILRASGNHPVVVVRRMKDMTGRYRNLPVWEQVGNLKRGDVLAVLSRHIPREQAASFNFNREVGHRKSWHDFMCFLGFFVGDGYKRDRAGVGGSVSLYTYNLSLARKYSGFIRDLFDLSATVDVGGEQIHVYSTELSRRLERWGFGGTAAEKTIPDWVMTCPPELQLSFIRGYLEADGNVNSVGSWVFEAASESLISRLRMMCIHLGLGVSNTFYRRRTVVFPNGQEYCGDTWSFQVYPNGMRNAHIPGDVSLLPDDLGYNSVVSIEEDGEEETFDLKIRSRHNFFADGILVHNSGGAVFRKRSGHYEFVGIPSRVQLQGWGDVANWMGYAIPPDRIYQFFEDQGFEFFYDPDETPESCEERRKKRAEAEREKLEKKEGVLVE